MSTHEPEPTPPGPDRAPPGSRPHALGRRGKRRRSTAWKVVSGVLAVAVVGLAIWAFGAQSDADDAQAALAAQQRAAAKATPTATATATPASSEADAQTQQEFEQVQEDLGATSESVDEIEQDLDQASAKADEAEKAKDDATGALDRAKAELEAVTARFEVTRTCLRGTLDAMGTAFESGGLEAAVQELQKLSGQCSSAGSS